MIPYDPVWACFVPYGPVLSHMVWYGPVWSCLVSFVLLWSRKVPHGPVLSCMVPYGPVWSSMVLFGLLCWRTNKTIKYARLCSTYATSAQIFCLLNAFWGDASQFLSWSEGRFKIRSSCPIYNLFSHQGKGGWIRPLVKNSIMFLILPKMRKW